MACAAVRSAPTLATPELARVSYGQAVLAEVRGDEASRARFLARVEAIGGDDPWSRRAVARLRGEIVDSPPAGPAGAAQRAQAAAEAGQVAEAAAAAEQAMRWVPTPELLDLWRTSAASVCRLDRVAAWVEDHGAWAWSPAWAEASARVHAWRPLAGLPPDLATNADVGLPPACTSRSTDAADG